MKKFPTLCLAFIYSGSMLCAQTAEKTIKVIVENPWNTAYLIISDLSYFSTPNL